MTRKACSWFPSSWHIKTKEMVNLMLCVMTGESIGNQSLESKEIGLDGAHHSFL
jgi:hypothetical protein